ncbi:MAG: CvpA family protein, partial [Gammaproteobacteria bacterium]
LFAVTLLVGIIVSHFVSTMVERAKLGRADRSFGFFFGILRGYVAVAALVALASFTHLPQKPWWQESKLIPYTLPVATWIVNHLPRSELEKVKRIKGG